MTQPEEPPPYGSGAAHLAGVPGGPATGPADSPVVQRVRTHHLRLWKQQGRRWPMLTAYDQNTAAIFDEAQIPVLLVGDSAANNVFGHATSLPVTVDQLLSLTQAVTRSVRRALVVSDLPFGSYQRSPEQAFDTSVRFMKEGGAHAVKLEGGVAMAPHVRLLTDAGIPVMAHVGFTPQAEHALGGYRVQGRGGAADRVRTDARAMQEAGAFAIVLEMVPGAVAAEVTAELAIPTVGIGAGPSCDAQVLVWTDMAGMGSGRLARFVKQYADLRGVLLDAARAYAAEVESGAFPAAEHTFE